MRPDIPLLRKSRGFGLVAAMFVLVVISLVIIAMTRLSTAQHGSNSLAIQQARAYQAARAGMEWGISQAVKGNACTGNPTLTGTTLSEFSVAVSCSNTNYTEDDGSAIQLFSFTVEAQNGTPGSRPDYAFRSLTAVVER